MENFIDWTTFICSVVIATIISFVTLCLDFKKYKQSLVTQAITANRINWIANVRTLVAKFLRAYLHKQADENSELIEIFMEIRLYIHNETLSDDYADFFNCLNKCCQSSGYNKDFANELIIATQLVLKSAWVRIKIEGGQTKAQDLKIRKAVTAYLEFDKMRRGS